MKFLAVFFFLFFSVQALTPEQKTKVEGYFEQCGESSGISEENVGRIRKGDFGFDDAPSKEFIYCMFKKVGIMNEAGVLQRDVALSKVDESVRPEIERIYDLCVKEQTEGTVTQELAWAYSRCFERERPGKEDFF